MSTRLHWFSELWSQGLCLLKMAATCVLSIEKTLGGKTLFSVCLFEEENVYGQDFRTRQKLRIPENKKKKIKYSKRGRKEDLGSKSLPQETP